MSSVSRRQVLGALSGAVLGLEAAAADDKSSNPNGAPLDVAVVGGGVAGVYAAWRLLTGDIARSAVLKPLAAGRPGMKPTVGLFELGDRIGGRLRSLVPPGMPHLHAEIGGMRIPLSHTIVMKLVEHLDLAVVDFALNGNLYYLRGKRFAAKDWAKPGTLPYDVGAKDRGKTLGQLRAEIIEQYVPNAAKLDERGWDQLKMTHRVNGRPLYDHGFWQLVLQAKGPEVYRLILDAAGHSAASRAWNAAEMMPWVMGHAREPRKLVSLPKGLEAIPRALSQRFVKAGGRLHTGHRLRRLSQAKHDNGPVLRLDFDGKDKPRTYYARHVILALPRRSIELLDPASFLFDSPQFRTDLRSVVGQPVAKVYLGYPRPWWRDLGIRTGTSWTDLPFRNCYYMGTEGEQPGADAKNLNSLLLASYHDEPDVDFWGAYQGLLQRGGDRAFLPAGGGPVPDDLQAAQSLVTEIHRQLKEAHAPKEEVPAPYFGAYCNWAQDPYGGGWHFWNLHAKSWEIIARMRQPIKDANLYVCGEAWSTDQGWIQGALHTTEQVLQQKFRLPRPDWLPEETYLGP